MSLASSGPCLLPNGCSPLGVACTGLQDYNCHLAQINNAMVTHGCLDIIHSLLTQARPAVDLINAMGRTYNDFEFRQLQRAEIDLWVPVRQPRSGRGSCH